MKLKKIAAAALLSFGASLAQADTVKMECGAGATVKSFCDYVKTRFEAETPHKLQFIDLPRASDEKLSMLQQIFATKDSKVVDVMAIDVVWPGVLDRHLLDLTAHVKDLEPAFFPSVWSNNIVDGRVKGVPNFIDAGVLFYRSDLLEKHGEQPPEWPRQRGSRAGRPRRPPQALQGPRVEISSRVCAGGAAGCGSCAAGRAGGMATDA